MTDTDVLRPHKKRKTHAKNTIKLGQHVISLDGYLTAPAPKPKAISTEPAPVQPDLEEAAATTSTAPTLLPPAPPPHHGRHAKLSQRRAHHTQDDPVLLKARQKLPIWPHRADIQRAIGTANQDVLILVGETGSGKSTQVPQFLYRQDWCQRRKVRIANAHGRHEDIWVGGMVAVTQPRRVAATTLAHRVAAEAGTPLSGSPKGLVGYSVRFDHRVPQGARIKFATEGMLLQELLQDPDLRQYSVIIVDEIHERGVDVDMLVGFLKQIIDGDKRGRGGVPLKIVIMSATADVDVIKSFFESSRPADAGEPTEVPSLPPAANSITAAAPTSVQVLRIKGRQHPVDIIHTAEPVADLQDSLLKTVFKLHVHEPLPGDILAFLTGQEEIESAQRLVDEYAATQASNVPRLVTVPLYGQLSIEAQHHAFQPVPPSETHPGRLARKLILATNIAETSVTVPGVRFVIDCGKAKIKKFHARLGMESLLAREISKSSAIQRAGRAGRDAPGKCYRLYTQPSFDALPDADLPEILRTDVLGAVLAMKARGIHDVLGFPLISSPDIESIQRALLHLHFLGALDANGVLTPQGRQMALFPVPAPYARVLIASATPPSSAAPCIVEAIDIISCLTAGEDIFLHVQSEDPHADSALALRRELRRREGDLLTYLTALQHYAAENADRGAWCRARRINARNMRQALNIRRQLRALCLRAGLLAEAPAPDPQPFVPLPPDRADALLRCFVQGFALRTAVLAPDASYVTVRGKQAVAVHPSSVLHGEKREAILFLEYVYTTKNYAKRVSAIRASWIAEALESRQ